MRNAMFHRFVVWTEVILSIYICVFSTGVANGSTESSASFKTPFRDGEAFAELFILWQGKAPAEPIFNLVLAGLQPDSSSVETDPHAEPQEKSQTEKLVDKLLGRDLKAEQPDQQPEDPNKERMDRAVNGMRTAGDKLDDGQTADETQKIQKQVIKDLEEIINQLENPPPQKQGGGGVGGEGGGEGGGGGRSGRSGRSHRSGSGGARSKRSQGSTGQQAKNAKDKNKPENADEKSGGKSSENSSDSSKQLQADRKAAEEAERRRKLDTDIWGHLPQHVREEMLSTYGDKVLPKYEQMVKQFYEALSTQDANKKK